MDLKKTESSMNVVTSTHQTESTVINKPVSKVWEALRTFEWNKYNPTAVKSVKFLSGGPNEVGSEFEVEYSDGAKWVNRIVEISELARHLSYELIMAEPSVPFTTMLNSIALFKVTSDNTTFVQWSTDFSNDVDSHTIQDNKFKKLDHFAEMKKHFA